MIPGTLGTGERAQLPLDVEHAVFRQPQKRIFDSQTTATFQESVALARIRFHIEKYMRMMRGDTSGGISASVARMLQILDRLDALVDETPPLVGPRRYGNLACRDWHDKVDSSLPGLTSQVDCLAGGGACIEAEYYLRNSFGSKIRLDYGTGHELSFLAFVAALDMMSQPRGITPVELSRLWDRYYRLVRRLIVDYNLEPAGSHGVWGLDDHFHLAYLWGASQFANNPVGVQPRDVLSGVIPGRDDAPANFLVEAIGFVKSVKHGPFWENSPMLNDILSGVSSWRKIQRGLFRMYNAEVLNKFPVVQHFWFGTAFFPWTSVRDGTPLPVYEQSADTEQETFDSGAPPGPGTTTLPALDTSTMASVPSRRPAMGPPAGRQVNKFIQHTTASHRDRLRR
ncbi:peptidylprolyl isomerase RRD1 KNAG_0L02170 [Huiozyma naganishii CBS 8797]|uniref:Serine/threonine-protein phosphatase 2A activator n=1 Tax=Huiozyma naganishii (strain ATCC MYA-139 / BCRC 22969 / CBS 8797 / KCTC 17520 / NBRC 10181 / NCYC 3082 / Yp74L-3) TaxID=1071383 RepID=J7SAK9_HUIN7|nr:hypothetical protein KNAG_0L02170 [Kazachstania naganishii CBS 8797]CCK72834.1 hypothetical protein KNAG_0L02170 [Kazachstania naganishii CBS 8797]